MSGKIKYHYFVQPNLAHAEMARDILQRRHRGDTDAVIVTREVSEYVVYNETD